MKLTDEPQNINLAVCFCSLAGKRADAHLIQSRMEGHVSAVSYEKELFSPKQGGVAFLLNPSPEQQL